MQPSRELDHAFTCGKYREVCNPENVTCFKFKNLFMKNQSGNVYY